MKLCGTTIVPERLFLLYKEHLVFRLQQSSHHAGPSGWERAPTQTLSRPNYLDEDTFLSCGQW